MMSLKACAHILLSIALLISVSACSDAKVKVSLLKSKKNNAPLPAAPNSFQISGGATPAPISAGGYILRGQIKSNSSTQLAAGSYKLWGEVVK